MSVTHILQHTTETTEKEFESYKIYNLYEFLAPDRNPLHSSLLYILGIIFLSF